MAGTCWQPGDWKKFERQAQMNRPYYVLRKQARNLAPWEDAELYDEYVFTERAPLTGHKSTGGGTTAGHLCRNFGPVYDTKPVGVRRMGSPGPQVGAPLGSNYTAYLDEAEIRGLGKRLSDAEDPRTRRM